MLDPTYLLFYVIAYLIGSIPTSVWIGKLFYGIDVRDYGSQNAGATNTFRVLGKKAAIPVLIFDVFKGWAAVNLVYLDRLLPVNYPHLNHDTSLFVIVKVILGLFAILGHLYPVFAGFRGGKGVATLFGMVIGLHPIAAGLSFSVFLLVFGFYNYVSLGAMVASTFFAFYVIVLAKEDRTAMVVFSLLQLFILLFTHRKNLVRLKEGKENKIYLRKKKKNAPNS